MRKKYIMIDYLYSEQLFLDLWSEYDCPDVIYRKEIINEFLHELVKRSDTNIVLDHYSQINFDYISKIEVRNNYTLIHWYDNSDFRQKYLNEGRLDGIDEMRWAICDYALHEYLLLDISKIRFVKTNNHLFVLLLSNLIQPHEIKKNILGENELIVQHNNSSELYTRYLFYEGDPKNLIIHSCIIGNLPYYTCVIQPKEKIPSTIISKKILLLATISEVKERLTKIQERLAIIDDYDLDELTDIGNRIRRVLEYTIKYYCVIKNIDLSKLQIDQKYGHITLGELRKAVNDYGEITLSKDLIITANESSHDSGHVFSKEEIESLSHDAIEIINKISTLISSK